MARQLIALAFALLVISVGVYGEDVNAPVAATPTTAELQAMIAAIQAQSAIARAEIVTVRMDAETSQLFDRLEDKMLAIEQKLTVIEDRFMQLKNDMSDKIDSSATNTTQVIDASVNEKIAELNTETKQYIRDMTNPIRINLPNFALWLMVTAAFMLVAGIRMQTAVKDAKREIVKNKEAGKNG